MYSNCSLCIKQLHVGNNIRINKQKYNFQLHPLSFQLNIGELVGHISASENKF
jgi:hypothetical protein